METITITLNGREVSGHPGMTVLELASESGVRIPTLCNDPHLAPFGACRICLVEDERSGALMASCVTPIAPGMVVNTESPRVLERRRAIVKLMLASHPDSCLVCDKGNRCELRRIAADASVGLVDLQRISQPALIKEVNPFLERDLSKCILCAKCIRADHELVVEGVIDYIERGFASKPATLNDTSLEESDCTFCGTCVAFCPTGALMEKDSPYRGTTTTAVATVCPSCGCGCGISLEVKDNKIVRCRPDMDSPVNGGTLCVRGSYGYDFVHSEDRLTQPLIKANGSLRETSWEEALDFAAAGLKRVAEAHGPGSLAVVGSPKCTNEENYLLQRLARCALGTNNIDNGSRLYSAASCQGLGWNLGSPGTTNTLENLEQSDVILVVGTDPASSAPLVGYAIKRAVRQRGARLIMADPRRTKLSTFAFLCLRPRVGTDVALLNGLARSIVEENLLDEEFVTRRTDNFEAFRRGLDQYIPAWVEQATGVPERELSSAARMFATAKRASIVFGRGLTQQSTGTDAVMALANLAMLTGNIGHGSGGVYALQDDCNGQGACDMGVVPAFLPGYQSVDDPQAVKRFAARWGPFSPSGPGLTAVEMIQQANAGKIKAMYIVGENPAATFPHLGLVRESLRSLDFLVVQDLFLTETARLATVVLPAASFAEKEGTFTSFEGRVQALRKAIDPLGSSLPDWQIVLHLAKRLGHPMPYTSLEAIMDEIEELVPFYHGAGYAGAAGKGFDRSELEASPHGAKRLHKGQFPTGFGRFSSVHYVPAKGTAGDGYPFSLITGTSLYRFGGGSRSSRATRLIRFLPEAAIEIGRGDASRLGIASGDRVRIISPTAEISAPVRITDTLSDAMLYMPSAFPQSPVNALFGVDLDPQSKTPAMEACRVRLERID
ncbi:MAG: formate dehydrogenase subunit alpha [Chloroflexi bacterium]|nr:formate dehydrogenase subunit alpha [Chloroflexota bacterium]